MPESSQPNGEIAIVLQPRHGFTLPNWGDLWRYRELLWILAHRELMVRYKQTAAGVLWALLRPFVTMVVMATLFGTILGQNKDQPHYHLLVLAAILPWQLFSNALNQSSESVVANSRLLTKVYFPRLIIPFSACIVSLADFIIAFALFAVLMAVSNLAPGVNLLWLPAFLGLAFMTALGGGLWLSAINAYYRDVRIVVPFLIQTGLFVTPIGFPASSIPEGWKTWFALNPMYSVVEGFRYSLLGTASELRLDLLGFSAGAAVFLFATGLLVFTRLERSFADIV